MAVYDLETEPANQELLRCDVAFHVGVLYHLFDPVRHLRDLTQCVGEAILLDTHVARTEQINSSYVLDGKSFLCYDYQEGGVEDVFSGMKPKARWLTLETLTEILEEGQFKSEVVETRDERNGLRVCLFAQRQKLPSV